MYPPYWVSSKEGTFQGEAFFLLKRMICVQIIMIMGIKSDVFERIYKINYTYTNMYHFMNKL